MTSFWDFDWGATLQRDSQDSFPDETIFATAYESAATMKGPKPGWDKDMHFVMSGDFFRSAHRKLVSCGNQFELIGSQASRPARLCAQLHAFCRPIVLLSTCNIVLVICSKSSGGVRCATGICRAPERLPHTPRRQLAQCAAWRQQLLGHSVRIIQRGQGLHAGPAFARLCCCSDKDCWLWMKLALINFCDLLFQ